VSRWPHVLRTRVVAAGAWLARDSDPVFGVKDSLTVEFVIHESQADAEKYGRSTPFYTVDYDFVLVPGETSNQVEFSAGRA
jgi:hypothetical protein